MISDFLSSGVIQTWQKLHVKNNVSKVTLEMCTKRGVIPSTEEAYLLWDVPRLAYEDDLMLRSFTEMYQNVCNVNLLSILLQ